MRQLRVWLAARLLRLSGRVFHEWCQCPECNRPGETPWCGNHVFVDDRVYIDDEHLEFWCHYCGNGHYYG